MTLAERLSQLTWGGENYPHYDGFCKLLFVDGFDHYLQPLQKWDGQTVAGANAREPQISNAIFRNSGGSLEILGGVTGTTVGTEQVSKVVANAATFIAGFAFWFDPTVQSGGADCAIIQFIDSSTVQVDLRITTSGHFLFTRNGTTLGTQSVNGISQRAWHYIEVKVTIDPSAGVAILNVDGSNTGWLNLTSQNTRASANSFAGLIKLGGIVTTGAMSHLYFDDFYLADTTGSFNNAMLGDTKVTALMPTADGTSSQYTRNEIVWPSNTQVFIGKTILDSNGNIQIVTAVSSDAKTTNGAAPTWSTTVGATTADNHATWTCFGAAAQYKDVNQNPPEGCGKRLPSTAYIVGNAIWDNNGNIQICTTAGTTAGNSGPTWSTTLNGTTADGTVSWTCLQLVEDTYLSDATIGHISRFTFPSLVAASVQAAVVTMRARKDDASVRSIRGAALSGGTAGDSGTDLVLSTSYQYVQGIFETDPNTGAAWGVSALNSAELGVKTTA